MISGKWRARISRDDLGGALLPVSRQTEKSMARQLFLEGEGVMAQSKELVPVDTGSLRSSGHVKLPHIDAGTIDVELGYGGPAAPYAVIVHENLDVFHPNGSAKYLELPFNQAKPGMADRIAAGIKRDLAL